MGRERIKMPYHLSEEQKQEFYMVLEEVCKTSRILESHCYIQHGTTSVFRHSVSVAYLSYYLAQKMHAPVDIHSLIRGALLHDYFLYDWHNQLTPHHLHGFFHPGVALRNASMDVELTPIEHDIIKKHMFPLTLVPPKYLESWIVCWIDKKCSTRETLQRRCREEVC